MVDGVREIEVIATDFEFRPERIIVPAGQQLRVTLINRVKAPHNIEFELPSGKVELEEHVNAVEERALNFTAPSADPGPASTNANIDTLAGDGSNCHHMWRRAGLASRRSVM